MHPTDEPMALTPQQLDAYRLFAGMRATLPRSAAEYNERLRRQAAFLEAGGSPDERLAAMLAREALIA